MTKKVLSLYAEWVHRGVVKLDIGETEHEYFITGQLDKEGGGLVTNSGCCRGGIFNGD